MFNTSEYLATIALVAVAKYSGPLYNAFLRYIISTRGLEKQFGFYFNTKASLLSRLAFFNLNGECFFHKLIRQFYRIVHMRLDMFLTKTLDKTSFFKHTSGLLL